MTKEIVFLKLGGSLITDKDKPYTPRLDKLANLSLEIKTVLDSIPELVLILGHGSGSFGHIAAKKHGTRDGVTPLFLSPHFRRKWGERKRGMKIIGKASQKCAFKLRS